MGNYKKRVETIARELKGKVLDVGCCQGFLHKNLKELRKDCKIYGIDIFITEDYRNDRDIFQGDAQKMDMISANSFDCVSAGEIIEHLDKPEKFIKEAYRILKKNGKIILTTNNKDSLINMIFHTYETERTLHKHIFTRKELVDLLERNNFRIEKIEMMPYVSSRYPVTDSIRILLHSFLPDCLREDFFIVAKKIS